MRCSGVQRRLSGWIDGELALGKARALEAHLKRCSACRGLAGDLRTLVGATAALEVKDAPAGTLAAIFDRLERARPGSSVWRPLLVGAMAAALIAGLLLFGSGRRRPVDDVAGPRMLGSLQQPATDRLLLASARRELARAELHYRAAVDTLRRLATEDSAGWPRGRRDRYRRRLELIEATVARFRRTAGLAPVDPGAQQLLFGAYRAQIGFLQRAILDSAAPAVHR